MRSGLEKPYKIGDHDHKENEECLYIETKFIIFHYELRKCGKVRIWSFPAGLVRFLLHRLFDLELVDFPHRFL